MFINLTLVAWCQICQDGWGPSNGWPRWSYQVSRCHNWLFSTFVIRTFAMFERFQFRSFPFPFPVVSSISSISRAYTPVYYISGIVPEQTKCHVWQSAKAQRNNTEAIPKEKKQRCQLGTWAHLAFGDIWNLVPLTWHSITWHLVLLTLCYLTFGLSLNIH